jgi:hypothetical protein
VDGCKFREDKWACDNKFTEKEAVDFSTRNVSVVMFLNGLEEDSGGEFVFVDAPGKQVGSIDHSRQHNDNNNGQQKDQPNQNQEKQQQQHSNQYKPSHQPSHQPYQQQQQSNHQGQQQQHDKEEEGRTTRDLSHQHNVYTDPDYYQQTRDTGIRTIPPPSRAQIKRARERQRRQLLDTYNGDIDKITKAVPVYESGINYTVVTPKIGRLVIFNASAENIHAVTQILNSHDRRYTLFMFIADVPEDNL